MHIVLFLLFLLLAAFVGINGYSVYLFYRLKSLVLVAAEEEGEWGIGGEVSTMLAKYLFVQLVSNNYYRGSRMQVLGDPESNAVVRAVKASDEFYQLFEQCAILRKIGPLHVAPYVVETL